MGQGEGNGAEILLNEEIGGMKEGWSRWVEGRLAPCRKWECGEGTKHAR
jgi:hypothetical protein